MREWSGWVAAVAGASMLWLAGCTVGPDYDATGMDLPEAWPEHALLSPEETEHWLDWWTHFGDADLNHVVSLALADNPDVQLQIARVSEARARLGFARADRLPSLSAQGDAARERQSGASFPVPGFGGVRNAFSVTGVLSYELDLWGRVARQQEAARALLAQTTFGRDAVRLQVITDVVATYVNLRTAQRELDIMAQTLASRERAVEIEQMRRDAGESDELTLRQAEAELEGLRVRLPMQRQLVHELEGALAVLLGLTPAQLMSALDFGDGDLSDILLPQAVPAVLPSALLQRRPDVRAAEAELMAATAQIGVSQAARLPQVNLSAFIGSAAIESSDLFTSEAETWGVGASVVAPLVDFGRRRANVDAARAVREQAEIQYRATALVAFNEVRDALSLYDTSLERTAAAERQVSALRRTRDVARMRYDEGFVDFITLLDAERGLLDAELARAQVRRDQLVATAGLFKALGGGWSDDASMEEVMVPPGAAAGE
ncbi:efflux transporter outer membrane subunit [Isoalcanivorax indicus]|uniref:efflux transporter outer membrane subunit n=1 Tax=Isoalcanivorax indicus TaxID=2202653 RepID=UPI000DB9D9C9|nr:efflux transporter outer membrane subunit [Isoalcanivorax indicus]